MYIDETDLEIIRRWLNDNEELAYIIPNGRGNWIAKEKVDRLLDKKRYALWHILGGDLPLMQEDGSSIPIMDPWKGWHHDMSTDETTPYFGPGSPQVIMLGVNIKDYDLDDNKKRFDALGMSFFEWIGDHYKIIGRPASKVTQLLWKKIQHFVGKNSIKIPRTDDVKSKPEIYAFPGAMQLIKNGMPRLKNPSM